MNTEGLLRERERFVEEQVCQWMRRLVSEEGALVGGDGALVCEDGSTCW